MNPFPDLEQIENELLNRLYKFGGKEILEIGCGDGRTMSYYADEAKWVVGIDNDRDELIVAQKKRKMSSFVNGDAVVLPFADSSFDLVMLSWSL